MLNKRLWRRVQRYFKGSQAQQGPCIIPRAEHAISRKAISNCALKVLYRLRACGFKAYLVGGGVRDLLLDLKPKDFDVVTDARPEQVRQTFRNSRLIGRRFKIVHVYFRDEIVEVSTFRANADESEPDEDLPDAVEETPMIKMDNTYGTIEEDAWRRDFTINALYYDVNDFSVVDYTGGMLDINDGLVRMIGDASQRFHEDPIRLLRAIRLAAKLKFTIHAETREPLLRLANLLQHVPSARLFDEVLKLFFTGYAKVSFQRLCITNYMSALFPGVMDILNTELSGVMTRLVQLAMESTDQRFKEHKSLNPGFLFAALLWPVIQKEQTNNVSSKHYFVNLYRAMNMALNNQSEALAIPRRMKLMMRSIWLLQFHLERRRKSRISRILKQRYFRAAFDFLLLRANAGEPLNDIAAWWQRLQDVNPKKREQMITELT